MTLFSLVKPYRKNILFTFLCIFITNILALVPPLIIKTIIDDVFVTKNVRLLHFMMIGFLGVLILRAIFGFLRRYSSDILGEKIVCHLREKIYWHAQRLTILNIQKITPVQVLTRITGDVNSIRRFIFGDAIESVYSFISVSCIVLVLLWINPKLTAISVMTLPLFALFYLHSLPQLKRRYTKLRETYGRLTARTSEVLNGMSTVRAFLGEKHEQKIFSERQTEIFNTSKKTHSLNTRLWSGIEFFTSLGILSVLWIGGHDVITQRMTPGALVAFYSYLGMLFSPIIRIVVINSSYQEASAALSRINEVLEKETEKIDEPRWRAALKLKGQVALDHVSFGYSPDEKILKDIHFTVNVGETVGIVGASGAGKTTLINLLLRFFDPQEGKIWVDDRPLKDLNLETYRRQVAVVLQDDFLFSASVKENICYGSFHASEEEIIQAAKAAQAHSFICQFPERYATQVGERGCQVSCGQRQRIAIARALLKNPSILILDEATSSVDALTENLIQKSIKASFQNQTVFVVAHRFSTIMEADKIIVLEKGRIVEVGIHSDLLNKKGLYSELYFEQFKKTNQGALIL